ncbi:MAG: outer membrane protein assembly factor BamB, partial [Gallionella sp.]|nr:outer membrane protein assembly factor BamB [Gallionella sp.]
SKVSSEVLGVPQVADGIVVVRSGDAHIAGLSASTGKRLWVYERSTPALVVRSHASVVIYRGMVFAGFAAGKLVALKLSDGSDIWETNVSQPRGSTELERISDITSNPVVNDNQICAIAFQGNLGCYDAGQGNPLWTRNISGDKGLSIAGKNLYAADTDGSVIALDKVSGSTIWKNDQLLRRDTSLPYEQGNLVVVGDLEGFLHGLSQQDGRMAARIKLDGSAILAAPQGMDGGLLVQTRGGEVYSLTIR